MRRRNKTAAPRRICLFLAAAGMALASTPAFAQEVEELVVMGRMGPDGPQSLSRTVSYADLDLTTAWGQDELKRRVEFTARDLCTALGEPSRSSSIASLVPSCRQQAVRDAMDQMRRAVAFATPRSPDWAPPANEWAEAPPPAADWAEAPPPAPYVGEYAEPASATSRLITNGPVPDTPLNRDRFGDPLSRAGQRTAPAGN